MTIDDTEGARQTEMPEWLDPMLAKLTHDPFSDPDWIYERKLDGERVIAYKNGDDVRLMSRNQKTLGQNYPELEEAIRAQGPGQCIVDGEAVAFDADGVSDFQRLQPRMHASSREEAVKSNVAVFFYLFDCMYVDGHDITQVPLRDRKRVLQDNFDWDDPLRYMQHRTENGLDYYEEACSKGWEGVIAKDAGSTYVHSRSGKWLKFKCVMRQEFVIGGFTDPEGERVGFGALLVGFYRDRDLVYAGKVGTGYDDETLKRMRERLDGLERDASPYDVGDPAGKGVHFVEPELVGEIGFTERTDDDKLRHPRFLGLRRDKAPTDVHKEAETQVAES